MAVLLGMSRVEPGGGVGASQLLVVDDLEEACPPELFVLTIPTGEGAAVELRDTQRGPAAAVFTRLPDLVAECGEGQPWARVSPAALRRLGEVGGFNLVAVNPALPDGPRHPEPAEREKPELQPAATADGPPVGEHVFVPSRPGGARGELLVELRQDGDGWVTMLVFTSEEQLRAGMGPWQPYLVIPTGRLGEAAAEAGAARVAINPWLVEGERYAGPVQQWASRSAIGDDAERRGGRVR